MPNPRSAIIEVVRYKSARVGIPGPASEGDPGPPGQGVPVGGTAGQVLAKIDATDYNTEWTTPSTAQGLPAGGTTGQLLIKNSNTDYDTVWNSLDADLTAIAALTPADGDVIQRVSSAWVNRTMAQLKASLAIVAGDVSGLGTMATQNANAVAITGGTVNGATIGATTPASGAFTTLGIAGDLLPDTDISRNIGSAIKRIGTIICNIVITGGRVQVGAGTAAFPPIIFNNASSDTAGLYYPALRTLGFVTGTTEKARIDSSGNFVIGGTTANSTLHAIKTDAGTNDTQNVLTIGRNSSNTPAANFASRMLFQLKSSTTNDQDAASRRVIWEVATHASRRARVLDSVYLAGTETAALGQGGDGADVADTQAYHFGRPNADGTWPDGTWRIIRSGNNLVTERRESSAWVTKQTISA